MTANVRHGWIITTAEAWPFASERAFSLMTTALAEEAPGIPDAKTQSLADDLEEWLQPRAGALSLEILRQFRDGAWFSNQHRCLKDNRVPLSKHLRRVARRYLCWNGSHVSIRMDSKFNFAECARRYRWLSLMIPGDLLAAAIAENNDAWLQDGEIHLLTPQLEQLLKYPVAQTHCHVGAALRFSELWANLMRRISEKPLDASGPSTKNPPFGQWDEFEHRLLEAAVARMFMVAYLRNGNLDRAHPTFDQFLPNYVDGLMQSVAGQETWPRLSQEIQLSIAALQRRLPPQIATRAWLRVAYRRLLGRSPTKAVCVEDLLRQDPIWDAFGGSGTPPETTMIIASLRYIRRRSDSFFERTFWQYQRIRCLTFRYLTQEPGTSGLDWFQKHYDRISLLRGDLNRMIVDSALRLDARDAHLGASEPRTTPDTDWYKIRDFIRDVARQAIHFRPGPGKRQPEIGLILHFLKERERVQGNNRYLNGDPRARVYPCRFGNWFIDNLQRARAIESALMLNPELLMVLRGIDVASIEQAMPMWPFLPLLSKVRKASRRAAEQLAFRAPTWGVKPLRMTLHAGEDFRRLVEGLRRIHEPIEFGIMAAGDRFGHALALGTDPKSWADVSRIIPQPREERLDDLLWELARYREGHLPCKAGRVELVKAQALEHAGQIYGYNRTIQIEDLLRAREMRHCPGWLTRLDYPRFKVNPALLQRQDVLCLGDYMHDPGVFLRGQEVIEVDCQDSEIEMLAQAQKWLCRELGRLEITVEGNPSSNLVIGDLSDLQAHPVFRLMPIEQDRDETNVSVSINVDNPITFASCLADEFAHTYYALLNVGVPALDALGWLEKVRQVGWRSRFTLEASAERSILRQVVEAWRRGLAT